MTPHFCLPALRHSSPAATSRPHRASRAAEGEKTRISPGRPLSPRRGPRQRERSCLRTPPRRLRGPGSALHHALARDSGEASPEENTAPPTPRRSPSTAEEWGEERKSSSALLPEESPPPTPPAPVRAAAAVAAGLQPGGMAPSPSPHHPAPASPLTSVPAHAQARPGARPPPDIAVAEGRGRARRGGHCPPPGGRCRLTCPLRLPALRCT